MPYFRQLTYLLLCVCFVTAAATGQKLPLTYYLPDLSYDPAIPTPESFLGWQIGEWHLTHDQQLFYLRQLAAASPRVTLTEYARSHEQRPLVYLTITSPANHARLAELQDLHLRAGDPTRPAEGIDLKDVPVVIYQGFSIHGNEPSGANAAPLVAYYLAAAQGPQIEELLQHSIILLDPSFNPDGMQRFSTWANMHKNLHLTANSADREYQEAWPGGRTNHYWFDLNRDWMPAQHPESQGRLQVFHSWRPNILTDHHEMGSNATFFFMPGEPNRVHPLTPPLNQQLTAKIGEYHARALDRIGSLYYSGEGYDDYYIGKGSTYPDLQGCVGILFEQASSRGHLQDTENGPLSFAFTIRNQVTTALSTQEAALGLRDELRNYQRNYFRQVREEARADSRLGLVVGNDGDPARLMYLAEMLQRHRIELHGLRSALTKDGYTYQPGQALAIKFDQTQYRLIRALFEPALRFTDSLFYDISTWQLPLAFNLPYATLTAVDRPALGDLLTDPASLSPPPTAPTLSQYAYLLPWDDYRAPRAAYQLLAAGLRLRVSHTPFTLAGRAYQAGTVLIPVANQGALSAADIHRLVSEASRLGAPIVAVSTGQTSEGSDLGSGNFETLRLPRVALLVGPGASPYDAGEVWHLLDQRYGIPLTKLATDQFSQANLSDFNTLILVSGNYGTLGAAGAARLKAWLQQGNVLIAQGAAAKWCADNGLAALKVRPEKIDTSTLERRPYGGLSEDRGSRGVAGAIFATQADLTHPLLFGYQRSQVPVFRRGTLCFEPTKNSYATPLVYTDQPLLSGYAHPSAMAIIPGSAAAAVCGLGSGRTICLADNPSLRAFWLGGSRLLLNGIFFGHTIDGRATETGS